MARGVELLRQEWRCEACGAGGRVEFHPEECVWAVLFAMVEDHREASPDCAGGESAKLCVKPARRVREASAA